MTFYRQKDLSLVPAFLIAQIRDLSAILPAVASERRLGASERR
jgi:hypothetical protein